MSSPLGGSDPGADLLFTGDIYCDLVMAGVDVPEVGGEVLATGFAISPGGVANPRRGSGPGGGLHPPAVPPRR